MEIINYDNNKQKGLCGGDIVNYFKRYIKYHNKISEYIRLMLEGGNVMYKELKLLILLFILISIVNNTKQVYAIVLPGSYKLIEVIEKDTTGNKVNDKIEILADVKKQGYVVDIIQHNGETYRLKTNDKDNTFIAPYTQFWKLNMIVADVNNDNIPEKIGRAHV